MDRQRDYCEAEELRKIFGGMRRRAVSELTVATARIAGAETEREKIAALVEFWRTISPVLDMAYGAAE